MGKPAIKPAFTIEDYLARERTSLVKHEYYEGEIFAMAGGTPRHSRLAANAGRVLGNALAGKDCFDYNSDLKLATSRRKYVYDGVVFDANSAEEWLAKKGPALG